MKAEVRPKTNEIELDLSDHDPEVIEYLMDQYPDRLWQEIKDIWDSMDSKNIWEENGKIYIVSGALELVQKIIEEKEHDMEWERKHGERK